MSKLKFPLIILNFKNYAQTIGEKGLKLSKIAEKVAKDTNVEIIVCPQTTDIRLVAETVDIPVFAQHIDATEAGSHTGNNLMDAVIDSGAVGSLVNHSEHRLKLSEIEQIISSSKKKNFFTCVCSNNIQTSKAIAAMSPRACAMEPPELIGSGISVTTRPDLVVETIEAIQKISKDVKPLVGAGVSTAQDVREAVELGAQGVLLASGFVKAKEPKAVLEKMALAVYVEN
ncbi:MAG: triose-phosphate isomerase [Candidatus Heimdallarchaeaceae archaeon]